MIEVLHQVDLCLEGVDLFFQAASKADLLHGEELSGGLVQTFEHLHISNVFGLGLG